MSPEVTDILGVRVSAVNMEQTLAIIDEWILRRTSRYICVTSVYNIMASYDDPKIRHVHNTAGLVTPDGMPMVWISRLKGHKQVDRVYGPDLVLALCEHSLTRGYRHFFYGGNKGAPELLATRLGERFRGLQTVGTYSPPFRPVTHEEDKLAIGTINSADPDIVWVGLGCPKQEKWMHDHVNSLNAPVLIGVGAAFDFLTGLKKQAPRWMQRSGLEMVFRVLTDPRRMARRFFFNHPRFVVLVLLEFLGLSLSANRISADD